MVKKMNVPPISIVMDNYSSKADLAYNGSREDLEKYEPSDHRPQETSTSSGGALINLMRASLGSGILAMPLAYEKAGLVVGAIGTIVVGLICTHALHILVKTSQNICVIAKRPSLGYADTCQLVFQYGPKSLRRIAPFARELVDWSLAITHVGVCCVYVVVVAESFKQVSNAYNGPEWEVNIFCALTLVVLIPLTQISKLKYLVPFSALANVVWLISICITLYYCLTGTLDIKDREMATTISGIPLFVCTSLFAMEGVGIVLPVENEMKKPKHFLGCPGVLSIAMTLVVIMYGLLGVIGYLKYGHEVRGNLILNLPQDEILAQVAKLLVAVVMLLSFALIYYVPVDVAWRRIKDKVPSNRKIWVMAALRLFGTLLIVSIACAIPRLEFILELVGAICLSIMGLVVPAIVEIVFNYNTGYGVCGWLLWKNALMILFAMLAMISGVIYSVMNLLESMRT